jgi:hypothetical protein
LDPFRLVAICLDSLSLVGKWKGGCSSGQFVSANDLLVFPIRDFGKGVRGRCHKQDAEDIEPMVG